MARVANSARGLAAFPSEYFCKRLTIEVLHHGGCNWINLLKTLKAYHACRVTSSPGGRTEVTEDLSPDLKVRQMAYVRIDTMQGQSWGKAEEVLEGYHMTVVPLDPSWR
ncbi:hypothetical protein LTR12_017516 [Friedmanniomyces endolithicus]|nr:hypothetical protein LTR12_017516 [Friedmanniomyces endolithicus]